MDGWIILPVNCKQLKSHASVFKQLDKDFNDFIHFDHFYKLVQFPQFIFINFFSFTQFIFGNFIFIIKKN